MGKAESNGATVFYLPATGDLYARIPRDAYLAAVDGSEARQ